MGLQGYALPSHENIGTAPFTSAPGLTLDGIQSVRDLTDISPVVQSHEDAVMPNALYRTPIRQPLTDYTEARFPTGAFEYHKSQRSASRRTRRTSTCGSRRRPPWTTTSSTCRR